ncbi:hypothetical protein BG006_001666 [Podila minutissima]|uniref:Uncharacterized protein n=1 Tax=Podila minutissima TaxID=64525 RepID=A0A9P5SAM1_9FUNG|nr:hypothetical protein BG006_001666 [Podila minutissima]
MGQLEASCFAQGSDNTLYALAYGYDLSIATDNAVVVLLKSNASPSNPSALTWQVVSTTRKGDLFSLGDGPKLQCVADPNGGFLAWSYSAYRPGGGAAAQARPGGFRYDPSLTMPSATTKGKGGWVNVETPLSYTWTSISAGGGLIYLKDGSSGKYTIYHAYIPGSGGTTINFGVLNTATTPNMMENSPIKWSISSTITGYVDDMKTSATKLFVWGVAGGSGNLFAVADLPQSGPLPTTAPSLQLGNYTTPTSCSIPSTFGDKVYKYCPVRQIHGDEYKIFAWDGTKAQDPIGMSQLPVKDMYTDAISGIFGDSSTTYMLIQSGKLQPRSGASGIGSHVLKALALTGGAAGSLLNVPNNITVPDNIAFYADAAGGGNFGDNLKTIVGIGSTLRWILYSIGILAGICCVILGICIRRRRRVVIVEQQPEIVAVQTTTTYVTRV